MAITNTAVANTDGAITDVEGVRLGHWTSRRRATGCTVVLTEAGATPGFHGAGGAPGTIDTQLLRPENTVGVVHAVLITGGSAHGLAAAAGVRAALVDRGVGLPVTAEAAPVPIVTGAVVFDQSLGSPTAFPGPDQGAMAVRRATGGAVADVVRRARGTRARGHLDLDHEKRRPRACASSRKGERPWPRI